MKKEKSNGSLIDELLDLKFGSKTLKNVEEPTEYLDELYHELTELFEYNNEKENYPADGTATRIKSDDFPENVIPFVVLKKKQIFINYTCPYCKDENKLSLNFFEKSQYKEYTCSKCNKQFLIKLDFEPRLRTYIDNTV